MSGRFGLITHYNPIVSRGLPNGKADMSQLPESVDWRDKGAITGVKDQRYCGSCWAFAAAAQLESYAFLMNGTLMDLSAEHITACTPNPLNCGGNGGCTGAIEVLAYNYVQLFGLTSDSDYPYTSGGGSTDDCMYDPANYKAQVSCRGYEQLPATDPQEGDYWLVKNSWDDSWGEDGFIRLKRESTTVCGTDSTPLQGSACIGDGQETQTVCGMCGLLSGSSYP